MRTVCTIMTTTNYVRSSSFSILNEVFALPGPEQVRSVLRGDVIRYLHALFVHYLLLTLLRRDMKRRVHIFRGGVHSRAVLQQQHNNVDISQSRRYVKRCLLFLQNNDKTILEDAITISRNNKVESVNVTLR